MKVFILAMGVLGVVHADLPVGLIGGVDQPSTPSELPYAALVSANETLTSLSTPSAGGTNGAIWSTGINNLGNGLIGGVNPDNSAYAAVVSPGGVLTSVAGLPSPGVIYSVGINQAGAGIIGGQGATSDAYGTLVATDGTTTALHGGGGLPATGAIYTVAINNSGEGLIGGQGATSDAYGALVATDGTLTLLHGGGGLPAAGVIFGAAINDSGAGLVGGQQDTNKVYAAQIASDGTLSPLTIPAAPWQGYIKSCAINNSGVGLIGGIYTLTTSRYLASVAADGTVHDITSIADDLPGTIYSVAINASGEGLVGGQGAANSAYAALVSPGGALTVLSGGGLPSNAPIHSVAINKNGVGLIGGGTDAAAAYVALVAPNGTLTQLTGGGLPSLGEILGVALNDNLSFGVVPESVGPYSGAIHTQLAAAYALEAHLITQGRLWMQEPSQEISVVADNKDVATCCNPSKYSIWVQPFGDCLYQKADGVNPSLSNEIAGVLAAFDYHTSNLIVGCGLGYGFNYIHYGASLGHAKLQEEMAFFYSSFKRPHLWINAALWGGLYQLKNERHISLISATSTGHTHGWILSPHLEVAFPSDSEGWFSLEPFVMFDWANNWQHAFTEEGASGFNLVLQSQYNSLLRSEAGLRFYETFQYGWGQLLFEEKLSYVNQAPFNVRDTTTAFVSSVSTFPVATGSSTVENLGGAEFRTSFMPNNDLYPYGAVSFQGEFNPSYQNYFFSFEIGKKF